MTKKEGEPQTSTDAVAASIAAINAENSELKIERDALKIMCANLTTQVKEMSTKIESDSREVMYPAIQEKLSITRVELDALPLPQVVALRETAARVSAAAPKTHLNSVLTAGDAGSKGRVPDVYGKSPEQIAEMLQKL
jgi:predicted nuclease with TOPRIM domain